jgi:hypothetical protein
MAFVPFSGVFVSQRDSGWMTPRGEDMTKLGRATDTRHVAPTALFESGANLGQLIRNGSYILLGNPVKLP